MNELKRLMALLKDAKTPEEVDALMLKIDAETTRIETEKNNEIDPTKVLDRVDELLKAGDKGDSGDNTPAVTDAGNTTDPQVALLLGEVKRLKEDAEAKDLKLQQKETKDAKRAAVDKLLPGLEKPFGKLTAQLLAERYVESGKLSIDESGIEKLLIDGKTYSGAEVLEQLLTAHKDDIKGEPGSETRPGSNEVVTASAESIDGKNGYQLLDLALQEQGI